MMGRLLTRCYARLLRLYPRTFAAEFGEEMAAVFSQTLQGVEAAGLAPAQRRMAMARLFLKETWDLPAALVSARRREPKLGSSGALANPGGGASAPGGWVGQGDPWARALLGAVPFLLFGLAHLIQGWVELGTPGGEELARYAPAAVYFVAALGLGIGWLRGFPRWSIAYLGMALYFGWYFGNGRYYGVVYGWRAWIPLLVVALAALLLTRSLRPLGELLRGAWHDWTRLSFLLYALVLPLVTIVFFDSDWGAGALAGLVFDTLLLAAGAVVYLRLSRALHRALALQIPMFSLCLRYQLLGGWYPAEQLAAGRPVNLVALLLFLLSWGGLMFLPGLVGLLRRGLSSPPSR